MNECKTVKLSEVNNMLDLIESLIKDGKINEANEQYNRMVQIVDESDGIVE